MSQSVTDLEIEIILPKAKTHTKMNTNMMQKIIVIMADIMQSWQKKVI